MHTYYKVDIINAIYLKLWLATRKSLSRSHKALYVFHVLTTISQNGVL